jgi:diguanylate cyclase (GGDEF)-like protein
MDIASVLKLTLENTPDSIAIFDDNNILIYCNHRFAETFNIPFDQTEGMTNRELAKHCFDTQSSVKIDAHDFDEWVKGTESRQRQQKHRYFESDLVDGSWIRFTQICLENKFIVFWGTDITEIKVAEAQLKSAMKKYAQLAYEDELTGVKNRRAFQERATEELIRSRRYNHIVSIAVLDIDFFKKVNDSYGHASGDYVLKIFAEFFSHNIRDIDLFARIGGEEFIILLPETDAKDTFIMANRLREMLSKKVIYLEESNQNITITCSIGISQSSSKNFDLDTLMANADEALYKSKSQGRNRCTINHK